MNILERVEIEGFWGEKTIKTSFHQDVNFFIGVNGSGKTTIINLIAASLSADFSTLDRIEFESITIVLSEVGGRKKPVIKVVKSQEENSAYENITYFIKEKSSEEYKQYSLDEYEEESFLRRGIPLRHRQLLMKQKNRGVVARLESLINVSWLSIHRANNPRNSANEESYESSVDQKLNELNNELARYFSVLSSKVANQIEEFQRSIIVSLITEQTESKIFSSVSHLDFKEEEKSLIEIFRKLNILNKSSEAKLKTHYKEVAGSLAKVSEKSDLVMSDLMLLISSYRSHRVVQSWNELIKRQDEIMSPKSIFVDVLNGLFQNKIIAINARNEIEVTTRSGKTFSVKELSSGEKQLVIILGEALLQRSSSWLYIADEPELSLHITWQETLIVNLRKLNPNSQILCATHSPDVVSTFSKNVFDMEKEIR